MNPMQRLTYSCRIKEYLRLWIIVKAINTATDQKYKTAIPSEAETLNDMNDESKSDVEEVSKDEWVTSPDTIEVDTSLQLQQSRDERPLARIGGKEDHSLVMAFQLDNDKVRDIVTRNPEEQICTALPQGAPDRTILSPTSEPPEKLPEAADLVNDLHKGTVIPAAVSESDDVDRSTARYPSNALERRRITKEALDLEAVTKGLSFTTRALHPAPSKNLVDDGEGTDLDTCIGATGERNSPNTEATKTEEVLEARFIANVAKVPKINASKTKEELDARFATSVAKTLAEARPTRSTRTHQPTYNLAILPGSAIHTPTKYLEKNHKNVLHEPENSVAANQTHYSVQEYISSITQPTSNRLSLSVY